MSNKNGWHRKKLDTPAEQARRKKYASPEHQQTRKHRVAAATPLTLCTRCGKPLGPSTREWHVPHAPNGVDYLPGLWCGPCNRSEAASRGARVANARRKVKRTPGASSLRW